MLLPGTELETVFQNFKLCNNILILLPDNNVDALTSSVILCHLLSIEDISYTLIPLTHSTSFSKEYLQDFDTVITLNCYSDIDIFKYFQNNNITFYIFDNRRPFHHENINIRNNQVFVIGDITQGKKEVTDIHSLVKDFLTMEQFYLKQQQESINELEDKENIDNSNVSLSTDQTKNNKIIERMTEYYSGSYIGQPISMTFFQLCLDVNKASNFSLWLAAIGVTACFLNNSILEEDYNLLLYSLQQYNQSNNAFITDLNVDCNKVEFTHEYKLFLHRHFSLYQGFLYSDYVRTQLQVGTKLGSLNHKKRRKDDSDFELVGKIKLNILLAKMGLSLKEAQGKFIYTKASFKENFVQKLEEYKEYFNLQELTYNCFQKKIGYGLEVSAADIAISMEALLSRYIPEGSDNKENFSDAFQALRTYKTSALGMIQEGFDVALNFKKNICFLGLRLIESHKIESAGDFRYLTFNSMTEEQTKIFSNPTTLRHLGEFIMRVNISKGKWRGVNFKPFVLGIKFDGYDGVPTRGDKNKFCQMISIETSSENLGCKCVMRQAFKSAVKSCKMKCILNDFQFPAVRIQVAEIEEFFTSLHDSLSST